MASKLAWITSVSCCLAFLMTSLNVTAKLSLLWLLRLYKYEQIHPVTWYTVVLVLLATPHLTQLIYILWNTPILSSANRPRFPLCWNMILGMLSSALEGAAMSVFASEVAPVLPEPVLLTIPYAVLALRVISGVFGTGETLPGQKQEGTNDGWFKPLMRFGLGGFMFFTPLVTGILLFTGSHFRMNLPELCGLVTSLLVLSGVWSPLIQRNMIRSRQSRDKCSIVEIFYVITKIISSITAVFLTLYCKYREIWNDETEFLVNLRDEWSNVFILAPVSWCLCSGILGFLTATASAKLGIVAAGMKVPFFLSPFLVIACSVAVWHDIQTHAFWELSGDDVASWATIVLSMAVWIIPFFFPMLHLMKTSVETGRPFSNSFISFSWNVFFFEPRTVLNYECDSNSQPNNLRDNIGIWNRNGHSVGQEKTIFLCTTMYNENKHEMERYVNSLKNTFDNLNDPVLAIEAHVLFDGAVVDGKLNLKARQLVALICERFQLKHNQLTNVSKPYGYQIHIEEHLRHTVFIHYKDSSLVKNKKRWSQVMYMNYILQFRCRQESFGKSNLKRETDIINNSCEAQSYATVQKKYPNFQEYTLDSQYNRNGVCTLSEMELIQMQAEYARIRRKLYSDNDGESPRAGTVFSPSNKDLNIALTGSDAPQLQDLKSTPDTSEAIGETTKCGRSIIEDRLIKTTDGQTPESTHFASSRKDELFVQNESTFNTDSNSENYESLYDTAIPNAERRTRKILSLDNVFVLATDADTAFNAKSVVEVLNRCEKSPGLGAVCGRTEPIGSCKPIVWYQRFEYAKDFWLVKASQNVIGSVTCCPGCFSLYRGSALAEVCQEFSQPCTSGFDSLVKDHGEDRWLCTLLMQKGWKLAYTAQAPNSTHCPETVGEFLRQRRRWVLSELSNTLAIFFTIPQLVRNNSSFSGMFLISLLMTFMWIVLSPSTTLVFLCAGGHVLFSVPLTFTLPFAAMLFLAYTMVCCFTTQAKQKMASMILTVSIATIMFVLSTGFVVYVVLAMQEDLLNLGYIQFRPYFLVFLLTLATIYAAVLHPRESLSLVYGLCYALLFPAIFVILPVYSLTNMVDQSWGTREPGSHRCCQKTEEDLNEDEYKDFQINSNELSSLKQDPLTSEENQFWEWLKENVMGRDVSTGNDADLISHDLRKLRNRSVIFLLVANYGWFVFLSVLYVYAGSDTICYCVVAVFSFSLVLQLVGLTCYRIHSWIDRYLEAHDVKKIHLDLTA